MSTFSKILNRNSSVDVLVKDGGKSEGNREKKWRGREKITKQKIKKKRK